MKKKFTAIIAARMGSSRFKGKTLSDLYGLPMIERLLERINFSNKIDEIILATTINSEDDNLEKWCEEVNINCFRGSSEDVLGRIKNAATEYNAEIIVEILGDNPLIHSDLIDACIEKYKNEGGDYVATLTNEYPKADIKMKKFPIGVRVQIFSINTLIKCEKLAQTDNFREHATSFIAHNPDIFSSSFLEADNNFITLNRPELTFAVNHRENLEFINFIYNKCYDNNNNFSISDAIKIYDNNKVLKNLMFPE